MKNRKILLLLLSVVMVTVLALGALAACNPYKATYKVSLVYDAEQGSVSLSPESSDGKYEEGAALTLSVQPGESFEVDGVTVNDAAISLDGEGKYEFVVDSDVTINVNFKSKFVDVGIFALKWANESGVLDLKAQTYSAAESFRVLAASGEGEQTEISVACDFENYTLKLTDDGKLGMYDDSQEPTATFQAVPEALAGAWDDDSPGTYFYYIVDAALSEGGYFKWGYYMFGEEMGSGEGYTAFSVEDGAAVITFDALEYGYPTYQFVCKADSLQVVDFYSWDEDNTYDLTPYEFELSGAYLYDGGNLSIADGELTLNGAQASYELKATDKGAGYAFSIGGEDYLLQNYADGNYLVGKTANILVAYSPEAIENTWYSSDGEVTFEANDGSMTVTGTKTETVDYKIELVDGVVSCTFDCYLGHVELGVIDKIEVAMQYSLNGSEAEDYVIAADARGYFFKTMTDNYDVLSLADDQYMSITPYSDPRPDMQKAKFTYVPELEVVSVQFTLDDMSAYLVNIGEDAFMVMADYDGILIPYSTYYSTSVIDDLTAMFEGEYTTGGKDPQQITFDFSQDVKKVIYQGNEYSFLWGVDDDLATPIMDFADGQNNCIYSLKLEGKGLTLTKTALDSEEEDYTYFILESAYDDLKGLSFTYKGEYYDESFSMDENGVFTVSDSDTTTSDSAVVDKQCDYFLKNYTDESGREVYVIAFNPYGKLYIYAHIYDLAYGMIMDMTYTKSDIVQYVGTYCADEDVFALERDGSVTLNGTNVKAEFDGAQCSFTLDGKSYTAAFGQGSVTLTADGNETAYALVELNALAFVGTYTLGEGEDEKTIEVTASSLTPNIPPTLNVSLNGDAIEDAVFSVVGGKPTLSFSVIGFPNPAPINYTLTLDGGKIVASDGTSSSEADANDMNDYSAFKFDEPVTLDDGSVIACLGKTGGKTPYFYVKSESEDITLGTSYVLSREGDVVTLEVTLGTQTLQLVYDPSKEGEELTVQWKASDLPPLPPPPPPAPPLP